MRAWRPPARPAGCASASSAGGSGVSPDVLRVWERRYGLLRARAHRGRLPPLHRPGRGARAGDAPLARAGPLRRRWPRGCALRGARAAGRAPRSARTRSSTARAELGEALEDFRDVDAQTILDRVFSTFSVAAVLRDVVLPYLRDLGDRWEAGGHLDRPGALRQLRPAAAAARASRAASTSASARGRCSPARRASATTWACCASGSGCATTGGASPTSARTCPLGDVADAAADVEPATGRDLRGAGRAHAGRDAADRAARGTLRGRAGRARRDGRAGAAAPARSCCRTHRSPQQRGWPKGAEGVAAPPAG